MVIANGKGDVLLAERWGKSGWQFPQGGMESGECSEDALYREMYEELGLVRKQVRNIAFTAHFLPYTVPRELRRASGFGRFKGQCQRWFLLYMLASDDAVRLDVCKQPEFRTWSWVPYWYPLGVVVDFKREVYQRALGMLSESHCRLCRNLTVPDSAVTDGTSVASSE